MRTAPILRNTLAAAAAAGLLLGAAPGARAALTARANHDHITVGFFYHGSSVSVRGVADPDAELVIKIASAEGHEALKEKGKAGGLLWMNVGTLEFGNAPQLYEVFSTRPVAEILTPEEADRHVLGYEALGRRVTIEPLEDAAGRARWFGEFIKFKEAQKLYATSTGRITFAEKDGKHTYFIDTSWPYQAPPGDYTVTVYAVRDGRVVETASHPVLVEKVGAVRQLSTLSKRHGALYGLLSILVALGAGFGVGLVFRKGGGAH